MADIKIFTVSVRGSRVGGTYSNPVNLPPEDNEDLRTKILAKIADPSIAPGDLSAQTWSIVYMELVSVKSDKTTYQVIIQVP